MNTNFLKISLSTIVLSFFIIASYGSNENKQEVKSDDTSIQNNTEQSEPETQEPTNSPSESTSKPTLAEKKIMCQRMFGGGDLSAWETAQAECMLNNSESACECMQILVH